MNHSEEHTISIQEQKSKIRKRYRGVDPDTLECLPAKPPENIYDEDRELRVAVYARVSTDDPRQTSSYELQKNHYTDFVNRHPNWKLVEIYADEGISGTSLNHRESFLRMIEDCYKGKIDMIITKSVSRFARNIMDCIGYVRQLKELKPPVGIRFEAEGIFTLDANSEMTLSFMAAMAQEESHNKSEIMNASIEMRFKRGIFLKPPLLGYDVDEEGRLKINEEEAKTVRLIFFMYLYGYTCQQIADQLTFLKRPTKKGNLIWNPGSVLQILQNERHCGDILARKTWTPNYLNHKSKKNKQDRNQYRKSGDHEAIISKDDFVAVQHLILNAKYELAEVHLMHFSKRIPLNFNMQAGNCLVEKYKYDGFSNVSINTTQAFSNINPSDWNFSIGGYQPLQKYLKDRKGYILSSENIEHYEKIVWAIRQSQQLTKAIDIYIEL